MRYMELPEVKCESCTIDVIPTGATRGLVPKVLTMFSVSLYCERSASP